MKCRYSVFLLVFTYFFVDITLVAAMHENEQQLKQDWLKNEGIEKEARERLAQAEKNEKDARRNQDLLEKKAEDRKKMIADLEKTIKEEKSKGSSEEKIKALEGKIKALQAQRENALSKAEEWGGKVQEKENERLNAERNFKQAEQSLEKIKQDAKELGVLLESTSKSVPDFNLFRNELQDDLASATNNEEATIILTNAMLNLDQTYPSYRDQREALKQIVIVAEHRNDPALAKEAQARINRITTLLSSSPKPINSIDRSLGLYQKIAPDQLKLINDEFTNVWIAQIRDAALSEDPQARESIKKTLQETQAAIRYYNLGPQGEVLIQNLQAGIDSLDQPKAAEVSLAIKNEEPIFQRVMQGAQALAENLLPGAVVEGAKVTADVVSEFVHFTAKDIASGVSYAVREGPTSLREQINTRGGELVARGEQIGEIANVLNKTPAVIDSLDTTLGELDGQLRIAATIAHSRYIPGPISRAIIERVSSPRELIALFKDHKELVKQVIRVNGYIADNVARVAQVVGKRIMDITSDSSRGNKEEQVRLLTNIEKAELLIAQERSQVVVPSNRFEALLKPIIDFGKKIGAYLRDIFATSKGRLTRATDNYQTAKEEYLKVLGFTHQEIIKNPDTNVIAERLRIASLDPLKKDNLGYATKMLAQAVVDIANVYNDVADKLNGTMANTELLIKAWDQIVYIPEEKPTISDMVQAVFDLRDMKIGYLQAMKSGIEEIQKTLKGTDPSFAPMANDLTQRLTNIVGSQIIETVDQYHDVIMNIDTQLSNQKRQLESFIK